MRSSVPDHLDRPPVHVHGARESKLAALRNGHLHVHRLVEREHVANRIALYFDGVGAGGIDLAREAQHERLGRRGIHVIGLEPFFGHGDGDDLGSRTGRSGPGLGRGWGISRLLARRAKKQGQADPAERHVRSCHKRSFSAQPPFVTGPWRPAGMISRTLPLLGQSENGGSMSKARSQIQQRAGSALREGYGPAVRRFEIASITVYAGAMGWLLLRLAAEVLEFPLLAASAFML